MKTSQFLIIVGLLILNMIDLAAEESGKAFIALIGSICVCIGAILMFKNYLETKN